MRLLEAAPLLGGPLLLALNSRNILRVAPLQQARLGAIRGRGFATGRVARVRGARRARVGCGIVLGLAPRRRRRRILRAGAGDGAIWVALRWRALTRRRPIVGGGATAASGGGGGAGGGRGGAGGGGLAAGRDSSLEADRALGAAAGQVEGFWHRLWRLAPARNRGGDLNG